MFVYINALKYLYCYQSSKIYLIVENQLKAAVLFLKIYIEIETSNKAKLSNYDILYFYFIATTEK